MESGENGIYLKPDIYEEIYEEIIADLSRDRKEIELKKKKLDYFVDFANSLAWYHGSVIDFNFTTTNTNNQFMQYDFYFSLLIKYH